MVADDIHRRRGGSLRVVVVLDEFKGLELCVRRTEAYGGWDREGECASAPEISGLESCRTLEEVLP